jgi:hypothetical protein
MISVVNKNQLPALGFVSGSFKAKVVITAATMPAAGATTWNLPLNWTLTTSQVMLPNAANVFRNGLIEPDFNATLAGTTMTIIPLTATDLGFITIGDTIMVEGYYSQK